MPDVDVTNFINRFAVPLAVAYAQLGKTVKNSTGQSIRIPQHELHAHTHDVVDRGHDKYREKTPDYDEYFESLQVDHIKWAAAVLRSDEPSASAFMQAIHEKVAPAIVSKFRHQPFAVTAAEDLPSRILMIGQSNRPRIAEYLGRSRMETWLIGIGIRLAINERNRSGQARGDGDPDVVSVEPVTPAGAGDESDDMEQSEKLEYLRRILYQLAREVTENSNEKKKLALQLTVVQRLKPAEIADALSVSRAYVAQIRSNIARTVVVAEIASPASIIKRYGLDPNVVQDHFWEILGATNSAEQA